MKNILQNSLSTKLLFLFAFGMANSAVASEFDVNGFGSVYFAQAFTPDLLPYGFYDQYPNFSTFSHLGFNVSSRTSERMTVAAQFIAAVPRQGVVPGKASAPNTQWELRAKWGFVNYDLTPSMTIKAGRQMVPVLFASEFSSVGYLLPYRQVPTYIFQTSSLSGFDGLSVTHTSNSELGELRLIGFTGTGNLDIGYTITGSDHNLMGLTTELRADGLQLHASYFHAEVDLNIIESGTHYTGSLHGAALGYRYDKNNIVSWGEYSYVWNPDPQGTFLPYMRGAYVLLGYRVGDFMPRYMYGMSSQTIVANTPAGAESSHTLGLNYQLDAKTVIKAEWEITEVDGDRVPTTSVRSNGSTTATHATAAYIGLDFVF